MPDAPEVRLTLKDFIVVIPLLGSAWAMSFGVGLFSAFGMSYIMMFSLSEHITAAIPSAWIALLFASLIYAGVYTSEWRTELTSKWRGGKIFRVLGLIAIIALIGGGACWVWKTFGWSQIGLIGLVVVALAVGVVCFIRFASEHPATVLAGLSVGAFLVAYLLGYISGSATMASERAPWEIVLAADTKFNGSLLYAGEKGVLLVVPSIKRTHYFRMDSIKSLSRESPGSH
jgi:hypothetical protein